MSNKIKFYLHNNYQANEIRELLTDDEIPHDIVESLTEEIYGAFYEIGFDVEYFHRKVSYHY